MAQTLKKRFIKYMIDHYSRMSSKEIDELLEGAMKRVMGHTDFSEKVLAEVVQDMTEEERIYMNTLPTEEVTGYSEGGLVGKGGALFDYTNPLDYALFIPGLPYTLA